MLKLFTSPTCIKCKLLKEAMRQANLEYEEITDLTEIFDLFIPSIPVLKTSKNEYLLFDQALKYISKGAK